MNSDRSDRTGPRPELHNATDPETILASPALSREQKIQRLRELCYDARELDVAAEEGMGGGRPTQLARILRALRSLGVVDRATDSKQ